MTRETKIGLVVAGSFLCLVCVVVASKWKRGDDSAREPETQEIAAVAPAHEVKPAEQKTNASAQKNAGRAGERQPEKGGPPSLPPANSINPGKGADPMIPLLKEAKMKAETMQTGGVTVPLPVPNTGQPNPFADAKPLDPKVGGLPAPPLEGGGIVFKPLDSATEKKNGGGTMPTPAVPLPVPMAIGIGQGTPSPGPPALPLGQDKGGALPPKEATPPPLPFGQDKVAGPSKDGVPGLPPLGQDKVIVSPKDGPPSFPPLGQDKVIVPPKDGAPSFPPLGQGNAIVPPKDGAPSFPPLGQGNAIVPPKDGAPSFPPLGQDKMIVPPKEPPLPFQPLAKDPVPVIPKETIPAVQPIIVGGAKPPLPIVKDTSVLEYDCQSGDSTFANLSMRFYGTDKYADALQAYNRTHSVMIRGGSNLTVNPPILAQGQKVLNPPKDVLESDYRSYLRAAVSVNPAPAAPNVAPSIKITTPTPLAPADGVAAIASPPASGVYRVQNPNGESILDIAERTLGNRSRWTAIYDLNRANSAVQPQFRIPAGTELKLPAN